jgi:hypothetical protein
MCAPCLRHKCVCVKEEKQIFFWFSHLPSFPSSFMFFLSTFLVNVFLSKQQHNPRETFCNLAQLQYPKSATTIPKTFQKVTVDNFP